MKEWQKILGLVLITGLILVFYIIGLLYKVAEKLHEGFQAGATVGSEAANKDPYNPGSETGAERDVFDIFELNNLTATEDTPTTPMEPYNPGAALAEFDDGAPVPWDFDNKLENPKDILWGYVDSNCSKELWTSAKTRALFNTANNIEIDKRGGISYRSNWLNGMIFHDPQQIIGVKFAEFLIDFYMEELIEGALERATHKVFGESLEASRTAERAAKAELAEHITAEKAAGRTVSRTAKNDFYSQKYDVHFKNALDEINAREARAADSAMGRFTKYASGSPISKAAAKPIDLLFDAAGSASKFMGKQLTRVLNSIRSAKQPAASAPRKIGGTQLRALGEKSAARSLAKTAGRRAGMLIRSVLQMSLSAATLGAVPGLQILGWTFFILSLTLLAVVPQVLSILADLDDDPNEDPCQPTTQTCPESHPYNLICAMNKSIGETGIQIVNSIPGIGDGINAFAPYLCSTNDLSQIVFRQSFRPPPYYFDTTLSLYYTEKNRIRDGGYNGCGMADPMYSDAAEYRLRKTNQEDPSKSDAEWATIPFAQAKSNFYHPWVDYAHPEMLDAMAAFYYDSAKKNQTYDIDGNAIFQYIRSFKGLIASSQFSCDVQVQLTEVKYDPIKNIKLSEVDVDDPKIDEQSNTGCSFHDRRFYFTVDFTKSAGYNPETMTAEPDTITVGVKTWLNRQPSYVRLAEYRKMFRVVGCTNCNGTAPGVIDLAMDDGSFVGEVPVALGPLPDANGRPSTYMPPKKVVPQQGLNLYQAVPYSVQELSQNIPNNVCNDSSTFMTAFGTIAQRPDSSTPPPTTGTVSFNNPASIILSEEGDFTPGLREDTQVDELPIKTGLPRAVVVNTVAELPIRMDTPNVNGVPIYSIATVSSENKKYVYFDNKWQPYRPKPVWSSKINPANCETQTSSHTNGTTKFWRTFKISPSEKQKLGQGAYGAFIGSMPLLFGFPGGLLATTFDVAGANSKAACTYMDTAKQTGTFAVNGFVVSSEEHFFINKGPLIPFAPGYVPRYTKKCQSILITQKVCASRYMIRSMNKRYMLDKNNTRRIRRITSIIPDMADKKCVYFAQDIALNDADKTDIQGSETTVIVKATPYIADTSTCAFTWDPSKSLEYPTDSAVINAIPRDKMVSIPPLTTAQFNALPITEFETLTLSQKAALTPIQDAQKKGITADFKRRGCGDEFINCSSPNIQNQLISEFNTQFMRVPGNPNEGYYVQIDGRQAIRASKTPMYKSIGYSSPVCVYQVDLKVEVPNPNGTAKLIQTMPSQIIKMVLTPKQGDACLYSIQSHDYPTRYFFTPVPKSGWLELPPVGLPINTNFARDARVCAAYSDCSNALQIERIVTQFNVQNPERKILRVVRASTPAVPNVGQPVCDYQVDLYRKIPTTPGVLQPILERETLRFFMTPAPAATDPTGCLYDIDFSPGKAPGLRNSGTSINKDTGDQFLSTPYNWATGYASAIQRSIRSVLGTFVSQDIPSTLKTATTEMKTKLGFLQNAIQASSEVAGCTTGQNIYTCRNPDFVKAFIRRYNFDNWPTYPTGQFGSNKRSVIGVRMAGLAGTNDCQIELIEKEESFVNYLKEPKPVASNPLAESNKKTFLRQYQFKVNSAALVNGVCNFTIPPFTAADIQARTFDISGEAYAINTIDNKATVEFDDAQKAIIAPDLLGTASINPWATAVLDRINAAVSSYIYDSPARPNFVRMRLTNIYAAINVRPNVIEYGATVRETYNDPDFGFANYDNERVILIATWDEPTWNPMSGQFSTGATVVPPPTSFRVVNVDRIKTDGDKMLYDGVEITNAPYLFYTISAETLNFLVDYDAQTEQTRVTYPDPTAPQTSYVYPVSTGWQMKRNTTAAATTYTDTRLTTRL